MSKDQFIEEHEAIAERYASKEITYGCAWLELKALGFDGEDAKAELSKWDHENEIPPASKLEIGRVA